MYSNLLTFAILAIIPPVLSFPDAWSFGCAPETIQRSDPLLNPGKPGGHTHVVVGSNSFSRSMSGPRAATDGNHTSCDALLDHSNYWVPALYHIRSDGKFEMVPFTGTGFYYQNRACNYGTACKQYEVPPTAFPEGLRMIAGNSLRRTFNRSDPWQAAISMNCYGIDYYDQFPPAGCTQLRAQITFPSCWNGVNVASANHQDHVAYPTNFNGGVCPQSHPIALPSIFSEWYYDLKKFTADNKFVWANGDTTTNGFHGDFINGWTDIGALQRSFQECVDANHCPIRLTGAPDNKQLTWPLITPAVYEEDLGITGTILDTLPGGNAVYVRPTLAASTSDVVPRAPRMVKGRLSYGA